MARRRRQPHAHGRLGVVLHYASAWLRPVENHVLAVPPDMARTLSPRLQELLGYNIYPPFIGYVDGRHPRKLLIAAPTRRDGPRRGRRARHRRDDRPARGRQRHRPAHGDALADAFRAFDADAAQAVAVLTGAGGTFCAGADLKAMSEPGLDRVSRVEPDGDGPVGPTRMLLGKPVIAAVEGHAVAGGLELAAWCDLRVAADDAVFGVYCRRWGIPLMDGGTFRLTRLLGHSHALDLILTGRGVSGDEALRMGLANRIVAKGRALEHAAALAHEIARRPQAALRSDRMSSYEQWSLSVDDALARSTTTAWPRWGPARSTRDCTATRAVRGGSGHLPRDHRLERLLHRAGGRIRCAHGPGVRRPVDQSQGDPGLTRSARPLPERRSSSSSSPCSSASWGCSPIRACGPSAPSCW